MSSKSDHSSLAEGGRILMFTAERKFIISAAFPVVQAVALFAFLSCSPKKAGGLLAVDGKKHFQDFVLEKVWEKDIYGRWCLPCPNGVVCSELADRSNREYVYSLFDYSGSLIKERKVPAGQGPDEISGGILDAVWLSSSEEISIVDVDGYIKSMDPKSLEIRTILKLSNVIPSYGSRFDVGRISGTSWEERDGRIVTTFESTAFYSDLTYYLVSFNTAFRGFRVLATEKKGKPLSWIKLEESRRKGQDKLESLNDYYGRLRIFRIFCVDWTRRVVYLIPDIEKPEIESISLDSGQTLRHSIDIDVDSFAIEREEFDFYNEYCLSQTPDILKQRTKSILYIPSHAPALMGAMVVGDHLLLITGKRDWKKGENQTLVYHLPDLSYEGCFSLPYSNIQKTKWCAPYYINVNTIMKNDDYSWRYEIFKLTERISGKTP